MKENFFDKLKRTVMEGAATGAQKVEEATRLGKIKLDIITEKRRLNTHNAKLGTFVYTKVETQSLQEINDDTEFASLLGQITEIKQSIKDLELSLATPIEDDVEVK
jgi:hypothetical protein